MNASGGVPVNTSSAARLHACGRENVSAIGEHVPVEVHRRLRPAGRARGERQQRHVVGSGRRRPRGVPGVAGDPPGQVVGRRHRRRRPSGPPGRPRPSSSRNRWSHRARSIRAISWMSASSPGAQHRHRGDDDPTRLEDPEPARDQPGRVGPAQQHPVARQHAQLVGRAGSRSGWRCSAAARRSRVSARGQQARPVPPRACDRVVEQRGRAVEPVGVGELGSDRAGAPATRDSGGRFARQNVSTCADELPTMALLPNGRPTL